MRLTDEMKAAYEAATPGVWFVRHSKNQENLFFVQAPRIKPTDPYDVEVLGDDTALYPTKLADARFIAMAHEMMPRLLEAVAALERCAVLFDEALPKFSWGASFLDADAVRLLNEVPMQAWAALDKFKEIQNEN
jgi:hypothetical protein